MPLQPPRNGRTRPRWLEHAFAPDALDTPVSLRTLLRYALAVAVGSIVLLLRQPGVSALDTIWAEDGHVFLADAVNRPFREVILAPYNGYALVVPRLLAEAASHLPLDFAAATLSGGSALTVSTLAAFVYRATPCLQHGVVRFAHASVLVFLPVTAREALNNAANLHWFLIFAAFWGLVWVPRGWPLRIVSALVAMLAALTDPLTLLLMPVVAVRLFAVRHWAEHVVTFGWVAGLTIQLMIVMGGLPAPGASDPTALDLVAGYGARVIAVNLLGLDFSQRLWPELGGVLPVVGFGIGLAVAVYAGNRPAFGMKALALGALAVSVAMFVVPHVIRWTPELGASEIWTSHLSGSRYLIVPTLMLFSASALLLDRRDPRVASPVWERARHGILIWYVAVAAMSFSMSNGRESGPSWQQTLNAARDTCADAAVRTVDLPIAPIGWSMTIGCGLLDA
jgi:hypothetical protein